MTDTLDTVAAEEKPAGQQQLAEQLLGQAREQGVNLIGPNGLLNQLTKKVLETALEEEMVDHLGHDKHDPVRRNHGNSRNGLRSKTVLTEIGPVDIDVPRDADASFQPKIVKKRQRRLTGVDEIVLSLTARGLTTGEVSAHFAEVYGASVSKDTVSKITDRWWVRFGGSRLASPSRTTQFGHSRVGAGPQGKFGHHASLALPVSLTEPLPGRVNLVRRVAHRVHLEPGARLKRSVQLCRIGSCARCWWLVAPRLGRLRTRRSGLGVVIWTGPG